MRIGILDHGVGNFGSVQNALSTLNYKCSLIKDPDKVIEPEILIIPGVSSFPALMDAITINNFVEPLVDRFKSGFAILGICSGMQILASQSEEFQITQGLNFIPGKVKKLSIKNCELPQVGFNTVNFRNDLSNVEKDGDFFFLNSYGYFPEDENCILATYTYGETVAAVIKKNYVMGIQFHPEKSHMSGVYFLGRALESLKKHD